MKQYKVISPYRLWDEAGKPLPGYAETGATVELDDESAERLKNARCVEEIEIMTISAPENRKRGRKSDSNTRKRVNN